MSHKAEMKQQIETDRKFQIDRLRSHPTVDYHDFLGPDSTKERCQHFNTGDIYINAAECKKCGWYVRSRNKHDMVSCRCGAIAVDGGSHYLKRTGNFDDIIERSVLFDWAKTEQLAKEIREANSPKG